MGWKRTLPGFLTVATFVVCIAAFVAMRFAWVQPQAMTHVRTIDPTYFGRRVLVIAPHPDDEVLTAGGAIQRLRSDGATVRVVIVTAGDGYASAALRLSPGPLAPLSFRHLGEVRYAESLSADGKLGLGPGDVISLGFPDTGTTSLWNADWTADSTHAGRTGSTCVPYPWAMRSAAPYTGQELTAELVGIIRDYAPDTVISPDTRETHPDHSAVAAFTLLALDQTGFSGRHLTALVHYRGYPSLLAYLPGGVLQPPPGLVTGDSQWLGLHVSPSHDRVTLSALSRYRSQMLLLGRVAPYMQVLTRTNELFDDRPAAQIARRAADNQPSAGDDGTVVVTPPPGTIQFAVAPGRIDAVRAVRGPGTTWIGIVSHDEVSRARTYGVSMRLVREGESARLDVLVRDGSTMIQRICGDSLDPAGVTSTLAGNTVWVAIPSSTFDGYGHAILQTSSTGAGEFPFRTSWRDVEL